MYNIQDMHVLPNGRVELTLIKETDAEEFGNVHRYINGKRVASIASSAFNYSRRGPFLVGVVSGNPAANPITWTGVGEWLFNDWAVAGITGNKRGCI